MSLVLEELRRKLLHEEDSLRRRVPDPDSFAWPRLCLGKEALLLFPRSLLLTSSISPSDSEPCLELGLSWIVGTADEQWTLRHDECCYTAKQRVLSWWARNIIIIAQLIILVSA